MSNNQETCVGCGEPKPIRARGLCSRCYCESQPKITCDRCGRVKPRFTSTSPLCRSCYSITRYLDDAALQGSDVHRERTSKSLMGQNLRENGPRWAGGRFITKKGYVRMLLPPDYGGPELARHGRAGYVTEHQWVAVTQILGRSLLPDEVVHHVNEDPSDNRVENLRVMTNSEHRKLHESLKRTLRVSEI